MKKINSFITFDLPFDRNYLSEKFATTHCRHQKEIPQWSTNATRQKVIARYWFFHVLSHFICLFGLPALVFLMISRHLEFINLVVLFIEGAVTFVVLLLFHYWPNFYSSFLPQLETIKETYERKQFEQLDKCKRAQLSNAALVLIYYVFNKVSGINSLQCKDPYAGLLMKLYGVDQGSLKKNLELIYGKKKNLSRRKYTEVQNRFQEAYNFLEEIQFNEGINILNQLEQKFRVTDSTVTDL